MAVVIAAPLLAIGCSQQPARERVEGEGEPLSRQELRVQTDVIRRRIVRQEQGSQIVAMNIRPDGQVACGVLDDDGLRSVFLYGETPDDSPEYAESLGMRRRMEISYDDFPGMVRRCADEGVALPDPQTPAPPE